MGLRILKVFAHPLLSESGRRRYRPDPQQGDPETTCSSIGVTIVGVGALTLRGAGKGSGADCAQLVHGRRRAVSVSCEKVPSGCHRKTGGESLPPGVSAGSRVQVVRVRSNRPGEVQVHLNRQGG